MSEAVTFLLTDVEGSTRLWEARPDAMRSINERHDALVDQVVGESGTVFRDRAEGDSSFAAFDDARQAIAAAVALQRAIEAEPWPGDLTVRVRAALHTGRAEQRDGQYYGPVVNRGVRLRALAHGGQVVVSEAVVAAAETLPDGVELRDLGTHRLKDLAAPEHVFQVCAPDLADTFPPLRSLDVVRNNLTPASTAFVGRTDEVAALVALLAEHRLVTVSGSGGVGKTRLAREVAAKLVDRFRDGVWFVDFTAARSDGDVFRAAADAVGAKDDPVRTPQEIVAEHLRATTTLLVLDNCEHVATAAAELVSVVLAAAPEVRVLITSRQPLGVAGERVWRVPPLGGDTAVALFTDRASTVAPERSFDDAERAAIAELCAQLDGIPLAIEMAAARVAEVPSVAALTDALRDRLAVSAVSAVGEAHSRQRTMRATIEWSHELLSPEERRLLRRLAAFLGGFTLDAAEGVCADERLDAFDVLDLLGRLVSQSLVQADDDGAEFRYRLLEVVREFAAERLAEGPEFFTIQSQHQAWFMRLAEAQSALRFQGNFAEALDTLERELPNLRRAIEWDGEALEEDVRYRLVVALQQLWTLRGHIDDGLRAAELVLSVPVERRGWRISVLVNAALLAERRGLIDAAVDYYRAADGLLREVIDEIDDWGKDLDDATRQSHRQGLIGQRAWCRVRQAVLAVGSGSAEQLARDAVELARKTGGHTLGLVLAGAGEVAYSRADYDWASELWGESVTLFEAAGASFEVANARLRLGAAACAQGRFASAESFYRAALTVGQTTRDTTAIAEVARNLADLAFVRGTEEAGGLAVDAARQFEEIGDPKGLAIARLLRLRAGESELADQVVTEAAGFRDNYLLAEAVLAAVAAAPDPRRSQEWSELPGLSSPSNPAWVRAAVAAALAVGRADAPGLCAAINDVVAAAHPLGCVETLRVVERAAAWAEVRATAGRLRAEILEELGGAEAEGGAAALDGWGDELCAVVQRSEQPVAEGD